MQYINNRDITNNEHFFINYLDRVVHIDNNTKLMYYEYELILNTKPMTFINKTIIQDKSKINSVYDIINNCKLYISDMIEFILELKKITHSIIFGHSSTDIIITNYNYSFIIYTEDIVKMLNIKNLAKKELEKILNIISPDIKKMYIKEYSKYPKFIRFENHIFQLNY